MNPPIISKTKFVSARRRHQQARRLRSPGIRSLANTEITRTEVGGTRTEVGGTRAKVGGTRTKAGGTRAKAGGTGAKVGGTRAKAGGTGAKVGGTGAKVGGTGAKVGGTRAKVGGACAKAGGMRAKVGGSCSHGPVGRRGWAVYWDWTRRSPAFTPIPGVAQRRGYTFASRRLSRR